MSVTGVPDGSSRGREIRWAAGTLLFALGATDRQVLLGLGTSRTFRPGQALITEGAPDTDTFVLLAGCSKVLAHTVDGRSVLLSLRVGGDLVGELAALDGKPRSASVIAVTRVLARAVAQQTFRRYLDDHPRAAAAIQRAVIEELRRATTHRVCVNAGPTGMRVALVLNLLVTLYGRPSADGVHIDVPLSQPELASLSGVSTPSLHRALTDLRARNVIRTSYRQLTVCDPGALRALATNSAEPT